MLIGRYSALLDANVLHPAFLRGAMLWFADELLFRPHWTAHILEERRRSLKRRHPDFEDAKLAAHDEQMNAAFPDALIENYDKFIPALELPDPDDRHVLAAAIVGRCNGIITANLKHFPAEAVEPFKIEVVHPDDFIVNIIDIDPKRAISACKLHRAAMKNPPHDAEEYLARYAASGLIQAHARLSPYKELL